VNRFLPKIVQIELQDRGVELRDTEYQTLGCEIRYYNLGSMEMTWSCKPKTIKSSTMHKSWVSPCGGRRDRYLEDPEAEEKQATEMEQRNTRESDPGIFCRWSKENDTRGRGISAGRYGLGGRKKRRSERNNEWRRMKTEQVD